MKYVAFLRGINNAGGNFIKMNALKKEFESIGFKNVKTILASGNVVFDSQDTDELRLSEEISTKLQKLLGRKTSVIVRSVDLLKELHDRNPFKAVKATSNTKNCVTFMPDPRKKLQKPKTNDFKILSMSNGAICATFEWSKEKGTVDYMAFMEKEYGKEITTRFWNTISRITKA